MLLNDVRHKNHLRSLWNMGWSLCRVSWRCPLWEMLSKCPGDAHFGRCRPGVLELPTAGDAIQVTPPCPANFGQEQAPGPTVLPQVVEWSVTLVSRAVYLMVQFFVSRLAWVRREQNKVGKAREIASWSMTHLQGTQIYPAWQGRSPYQDASRRNVFLWLQ